MLDPTVNQALRSNGDDAWFGWAKDEQIEKLRAEWIKATDIDTRKKLAVELQKRAFESVPYIPTGEFMQKTAYRKNIKGRILAPAYLLWNVEKT
jgi:peptide/nickel transport system substrate-binding protein